MTVEPERHPDGSLRGAKVRVGLELSALDRAQVDRLRAEGGLSPVDWDDPYWRDPDLPKGGRNAGQAAENAELQERAETP